MSDTTQTAPKIGEVWESRSGRRREVVSVDEDGYWVMYSRPAPAPAEATTILGIQWRRLALAWRHGADMGETA